MKYCKLLRIASRIYAIVYVSFNFGGFPPPRPVPRWLKTLYALPFLQVSGRFALTAGENIGAGDASEFSNRQLWGRAAGLSGADAIIDTLPFGYDTLLEDAGGPAAAAAAGGVGEKAMGR